MLRPAGIPSHAPASPQPHTSDSGRSDFSLGWFSWRRRALLLQLLGTVVVLGWLPGNAAKLGAMLAIWVIGFGKISRGELLAVALVDMAFVAMDKGALRQGVFSFDHPDILGLPVYEFFMWGFYVLHMRRFLHDQTRYAGNPICMVGFATAFSICFLSLTNPLLLAAGAGMVLAAAILLFHEPMDLAGTAYMAGVGALVEYVGVGTGQWSYPHAPGGWIPLWSFVMWAGVGLFSRRLLALRLDRTRTDRTRTG